MSVKHIVLGLLEHGPAHGYRLRERLNRSFLAGRELEPSHVYALLAELARAGLVVAVDEDPPSRRRRRCYALTDAGREVLRRWLVDEPACRAFVARPLLIRVALAAHLGERLDAKLLRAERRARERLVRELRDERRGSTLERLADLRTLAHLADLRTLAHLEAELELLGELEAFADAARGERPVSSRPAASGSR
ncbi:MAG TPA: PadR family transcriptional regulator [Candidatus Binatia bacterium]